MTNEALQRRKYILEQLGHDAHASRSSWSHDLGDAIVFDAWDDQWERDEHGKVQRYPLRTINSGYSLKDSQENPRRGHTRWQHHVDLVLTGKRRPRAILPVAFTPDDHGKKGAKGWRAMVVDGEVQTDREGQTWLIASQVTRLRSAGRA
ncbi:hypothetical protein [Lysobacter sp. A289]